MQAISVPDKHPIERYHITGERPAYGQAVNRLLEAFDLGLTGAFVHFDYIMTAKIAPDSNISTPDRMSGVKSSFEALGCINVEIKLIDRREPDETTEAV